MITYKAEYLGSHDTVYSFDAAKAFVAQQAGRTLRWVENSEENAWHGYRSKQEAADADPSSPVGFIGRILASTHPDF
jgi:hypothetical protein